MGTCDLCGGEIGVGGRQYTAHEFQAKVRAGLRPPESAGGVAKAMGVDAPAFGDMWAAKAMGDQTGWALCDTCAQRADGYVGAPVSAETGASGQPTGFLQNLIDVYFSPREAFDRIVRCPAWILPAAGYLVLVVAFTAIWMNKMEPREFMKAQLEQTGQAEKMTAEQREQVIEQQAKFMPIFGWIGAIVGTIVTLVVVATFFLFIYRFFYGGELKLGQSLAVASWVFFAVGLITTPLMLTVFGLKGDWNLNPQDVLQANLALLLDRSTAAKPLWALLSSIDLFSIWTVFLLATGYAAATRKSTSSAIWGVAVPWLLIVLIKVGWAAIF